MEYEHFTNFAVQSVADRGAWPCNQIVAAGFSQNLPVPFARKALHFECVEAAIRNEKGASAEGKALNRDKRHLQETYKTIVVLT